MASVIDGNKLTRVQRDRVRRANERFDKMTTPQKAVAVAKDVIAQLKNKRYQATTSIYITDVVTPEVCNSPSAAALGPKDISCKVCARGSIIVSAARLFNQCPLKSHRDNVPGPVNRWHSGLDGEHRTFHQIERSIFTQEQVDMIEAAFECWDAKYPECRKFGEKYNNSTDRMIAIMENIVKNKGTFVPQQ